MRIIAAQPGWDVSVIDVHTGWVEALRAAGHQVLDWNLNDRLVFYDKTFLREDGDDEFGTFRKALSPPQAMEFAVDGLYSTLYRNHPDLLLITTGTFIPAGMCDLSRFRGTKVLIVHTESPYEDERQLTIGAHADLNVINDPTNLEQFTAAAPTIYLPAAYRPTLHHPGAGHPDLMCDFAFVGTGFPTRIELLEAMDFHGADVVLAGNWRGLTEGSPLRKYVAHNQDEFYDNEQTTLVYQSAKVGLNYYRRVDGEPQQGWAMGPREVEMAACGLFFLRDPRGEGDEVLPMLPRFEGPEQASDLLAYWLAHPDERAERVAAARAAVADRTFDRNVARALAHLQEG